MVKFYEDFNGKNSGILLINIDNKLIGLLGNKFGGEGFSTSFKTS